jgi:hypothetical protein
MAKENQKSSASDSFEIDHFFFFFLLSFPLFTAHSTPAPKKSNQIDDMLLQSRNAQPIEL